MDFLKNIRYPGRFIVLGRDQEYFVGIYAATGRSNSSLNRRYIQNGNEIIAEQLQAGGNEDLLTYPAFCFLGNGIVIANGRQGKTVASDRRESAQQQLEQDLSTEKPEPDEYQTPRITGLYFETSLGAHAGLHIVRQLGRKVNRQAWAVPLRQPGQGKYISTYSGEDVRPTPSFEGCPKDVSLHFGSAQVAANTVFELLAPPMDGKDYRVGVIACYKKRGEQPTVCIKNRMDFA